MASGRRCQFKRFSERTNLHKEPALLFHRCTPGVAPRPESGHMQLPDDAQNMPGKILDHDAGIGEVDGDMIADRARELAEIDGLEPDQVNEGHRQQAREELRGGDDPTAPNDDEGVEASLIEADDVPGESGGAVEPFTNAAMHGDEQTIGEQLYSEGIAEADHDRMVDSRQQERREE